MKKTKNALRTLLALLLLLSLFLVSVSALPAVVSGSETAGTVDAVINAASTESAIRFSADRAVRLKSFSTGGYAYTMYTLLPYGYAILCDETGALMEACYEESALPPYPVAHLKDFYYGGPLNYFILENGEYRDLCSQKSLSDNELVAFARLDGEVRAFTSVQTEPVVTAQSTSVSLLSNGISYTVQPNYIRNLTNFPVNDHGTCTVISAVLLFSYYDDYVNDAFIAPANELSSDSEALHTLLVHNVYGSNLHNNGVYIRDALSGFNTYLASRGISSRVRSIYQPEDTARNKILTELSDGRPVIASMGEGLGATYDHSVLVYGITLGSSGTLSGATLTMHMGSKKFNTTNVPNYSAYVASIGWFYECGYLDCPTGHNYSAWTSTGSYSHMHSCSNCGDTETEPHSAYWNPLRQKCNRCGYSGPLTEPFRYGEAVCGA